MRITRVLLITWALLTTPFSVALAQEAKSSFTEAQITELAKKIQDDAKLSAKYKTWNQGYDISFKVGAFILAAFAAIGAARVSALGQTPPPTWLKTSNLALTSVTALVTGLGFTQFDFAKRHANWEKRFYALESCEMTLRFAQPDRETFLQQLEAIKKWGDYTNPSDMTASCNSEPKTTKGTKEKTEQVEKPASAAST